VLDDDVRQREKRNPFGRRRREGVAFSVFGADWMVGWGRGSAQARRDFDSQFSFFDNQAGRLRE
ncbi:MAG: hypothetical protein ACK5P8_03845, partial [Phycisphaerae bacterium]